MYIGGGRLGYRVSQSICRVKKIRSALAHRAHLRGQHSPQRHQFVWLRQNWTAGLCDVGRAWFHSSFKRSRLRGPGAAIRRPSRLRPLWGKVLWSSASSLRSPGGMEGGALLYARKYYLAAPSILIRETAQKLQPQRQVPLFLFDLCVCPQFIHANRRMHTRTFINTQEMRAKYKNL